MAITLIASEGGPIFNDGIDVVEPLSGVSTLRRTLGRKTFIPWSNWCAGTDGGPGDGGPEYWTWMVNKSLTSIHCPVLLLPQ